MDLKFKIKDPQHSGNIQKILFSQGFEWAGSEKGVSNDDMPFLYTDNSDMSITYSGTPTDFGSEPEVEALLVHPKQLEFLKKLFKPNHIVLNVIDTKFYLKRDSTYLNKLLNKSK